MEEENKDNLDKYKDCKKCPNRKQKKMCCCGCVFDFCKYSLED